MLKPYVKRKHTIIKQWGSWYEFRSLGKAEFDGDINLYWGTGGSTVHLVIVVELRTTSILTESCVPARTKTGRQVMGPAWALTRRSSQRKVWPLWRKMGPWVQARIKRRWRNWRTHRDCWMLVMMMCSTSFVLERAVSSLFRSSVLVVGHVKEIYFTLKFRFLWHPL